MQFRTVVEINLGEVDVSEMTDGGAAAGTFDFAGQLPAGFQPIAGKIQNIETFAGQTAATCELGTAADPDAFIDGKDILTLGKFNTITGADPDVAIDSDTTVRLTVTGNDDFTSFTAGKVAVSLYCIDCNEPVTVETN